MTKQNCFIACIIILVNTFNFVANYDIIEIKVSTMQKGKLMTSEQEKEQAKATLFVKTIFFTAYRFIFTIIYLSIEKILWLKCLCIIPSNT